MHGDPLIYATVVLYENGTIVNSASTDIDGNYQITVSNQGTYEVRFTYLGYETQQKSVTVASGSYLYIVDATLEEDVKSLGSVVISNGVTISGSTISRETIQKLPTVSASSAAIISPAVYSRDGTVTSRTGEKYDKVDESKFLRASENPLSTFSIDVDRASYTIARSYLEDSAKVPEDAVRIEEFLNYFRYQPGNVSAGEPFGVFPELSECPWNKKHYLLRLQLSAKELSASEVPPANLVFLVDVSGSMDAHNKLPLVKESLTFLLDRLREEDLISIVTYSEDIKLALPAISVSEKDSIKHVIESLKADGGTHGAQGLQMAYEEALLNFIPEGNNRIILCTDGDFNIGITDETELKNYVEAQSAQGTSLTVLGFGMGNYQDSRVEKLADYGDGNYAYIDGMEEAEKFLGRELNGTMNIVARDMKIQVEFNPERVKEYRLIGYDNRRLATEEFEDDSTDAGELGSGHLVTVFYEIEPGKEVRNTRDSSLRYSLLESSEWAYVKTRHKLAVEDSSTLNTYIVKGAPKPWNECSKDHIFSSAVVCWALWLKDSGYKGKSSVSLTRELLQALPPHYFVDKDKQELANLVDISEWVYKNTDRAD